MDHNSNGFKSKSIDYILKNIIRNLPSNARIISIAGGSGSGKTYFSEKLSQRMNVKVMKLDDYIIPRTINKDSNWDLPTCWDLKLVKDHLQKFSKRKRFSKPIYDFKTGTNSKSEIIYPSKQIILEGLYALHDSLIGLVDFSIYLEGSEERRLNRVLERDLVERGTKTRKKILKRWNETVQPTYESLVEPQSKKADIILWLN